MTWDAIGAIGEIVGALAVVLTLGYLANQVRHAKEVAADTNRLERSKGVRDMMLASASNSDLSINAVPTLVHSSNSDLRENLTKGLLLSDYYSEIASKLNMSSNEAASFDWTMLYWFWLHWGQYASTTKDSDVEELRNVISGFYRNPGVRLCWEKSPWA